MVQITANVSALMSEDQLVGSMNKQKLNVKALLLLSAGPKLICFFAPLMFISSLIPHAAIAKTCQASGSDLGKAINNYEASCEISRADCDPIGDQWVCSSSQINASAPSLASRDVFEPYRAYSPIESTTRQPTDPKSWLEKEVYQKPGYELSFSDEFNDNELSPLRWNTQLRWDGEFNGERYEYRLINGEAQFYVNPFSEDQAHKDKLLAVHNPFELDGSRLAIRAILNPLYTGENSRTHGSLDEMVAQQPFLSGALASYNFFSQKYGYFEARIKLPSHIGTFPAFWLHHQRQAWQQTRKSEIDVMENLGHAPHLIYNSFHYFDNVSVTYGGVANFLKPSPDGQIYTGLDYSEDYHVYAVEWEPGRIVWSIDGVAVSELINPNVDHERLYIILNLAMGGNWVNFPTNAGGMGRSRHERYPSEQDRAPENFSNPAMEIDYVRVYKRK